MGVRFSLSAMKVILHVLTMGDIASPYKFSPVGFLHSPLCICLVWSLSTSASIQKDVINLLKDT